MFFTYSSIDLLAFLCLCLWLRFLLQWKYFSNWRLLALQSPKCIDLNRSRMANEWYDVWCDCPLISTLFPIFSIWWLCCARCIVSVNCLRSGASLYFATLNWLNILMPFIWRPPCTPHQWAQLQLRQWDSIVPFSWIESQLNHSLNRSFSFFTRIQYCNEGPCAIFEVKVTFCVANRVCIWNI